MARKNRYERLVAAIDRARKPAPLDDPLPKRMPSQMVRPVYNTNFTRCFEESITNIRPGSNRGQWRGTVVDSLGRRGTVQVWWNSARQCWQYA